MSWVIYIVCVYRYMYGIEKQRERERDRDRERQREREGETERQRETERARELLARHTSCCCTLLRCSTVRNVTFGFVRGVPKGSASRLHLTRGL